MYKRLISLGETEQVSLAEPEYESVYPVRNLFLNGLNSHYP